MARLRNARLSALEWRAAARADLLAIVDYISDTNTDAA
jgi:plasmid stabilization system protein ParE